MFAVSVKRHVRKLGEFGATGIHSDFATGMPNPQLAEDNELARLSRQIYRQCSVEPEPFLDVRYFAPSDPNNPHQPQTRRRNHPGQSDWINVEPICWEYLDIRG